MNTTPSVLAASAKVAARFIQRTRWVMNLQSDITAVEASLKDYQELRLSIEKRLAIAEYNFKQAEVTENPQVEDFAKNLDSVKKSVERDFENLERDTKNAEKEIEDLKKDIVEVETGKKKVRRDVMIEKAKELVASRVEASYCAGDFDKTDNS